MCDALLLIPFVLSVPVFYQVAKIQTLHLVYVVFLYFNVKRVGKNIYSQQKTDTFAASSARCYVS